MFGESDRLIHKFMIARVHKLLLAQAFHSQAFAWLHKEAEESMKQRKSWNIVFRL